MGRRGRIWEMARWPDKEKNRQQLHGDKMTIGKEVQKRYEDQRVACQSDGG